MSKVIQMVIIEGMTNEYIKKQRAEYLEHNNVNNTDLL
jgi:hypothetical protein